MSYVEKLVCARCKAEHSPKTGATSCAKEDGGRLDVIYDYEAIKEIISKDELERRPACVWKYFELLPLEHKESIVSLGEGGTPLIRADKLAKRLGLRNLFVKDDTRNPTYSFKDRPMTVGLSKAVELGKSTVASASSGNAAAALAAYAAKAGLACYTFVPEKADPGKIAQLILYGANVLRVRKTVPTEDPTVKLLRLATSKFGWYPCPSFGPFNPYQAEGPKTLSYEIVEQLNWKVPDWLIVPVGAGGLLGGNWKGFLDFEVLGLISGHPRMVAVQPNGCAPVVRAFQENRDPFHITPWQNPDSVASGLLDPFPWDGDLALEALRRSSGSAVAVTDGKILEAQRTLARDEGIFAEPSGVVSLAGLIELKKRGDIDETDLVVVEVTGSGLKDLRSGTSSLAEPPVIQPDIGHLEEHIKTSG